MLSGKEHDPPWWSQGNVFQKSTSSSVRLVLVWGARMCSMPSFRPYIGLRISAICRSISGSEFVNVAVRVDRWRSDDWTVREPGAESLKPSVNTNEVGFFFGASLRRTGDPVNARLNSHSARKNERTRKNKLNLRPIINSGQTLSHSLDISSTSFRRGHPVESSIFSFEFSP